MAFGGSISTRSVDPLPGSTITGEHTWPDTLDIMGWDVDPQRLGVIFAQAIPPFARRNIGPAVSGILARSGHGMAVVDRFVCHPGGRKVVSALESALALEAGTLDHERAVLKDHGNMSSPTVFFVLERVLRQGLPEVTVINALGPGYRPPSRPSVAARTAADVLGFVAMCVGMFMAILDVQVVATSLPAIQKALGIAPASDLGPDRLSGG